MPRKKAPGRKRNQRKVTIRKQAAGARKSAARRKSIPASRSRRAVIVKARMGKVTEAAALLPASPPVELADVDLGGES
jgi:hypothetical protein